MLQMWKGEVFCPMYADVRPLPAPRPPPKGTLLDQVNTAIVERFGDHSKCLSTTAQRQPDVRWLLDVLAVLSPKHPNFSKGYSYEKMPPTETFRLKVQHLQHLGDMQNPSQP